MTAILMVQVLRIKLMMFEYNMGQIKESRPNYSDRDSMNICRLLVMPWSLAKSYQQRTVRS